MKKLDKCVSKKEVEEVIWGVVGNIIVALFVMGGIYGLGTLIYKAGLIDGEGIGYRQGSDFAESLCTERVSEVRHEFNEYKNYIQEHVQ